MFICKLQSQVGWGMTGIINTFMDTHEWTKKHLQRHIDRKISNVQRVNVISNKKKM